MTRLPFVLLSFVLLSFVLLVVAPSATAQRGFEVRASEDAAPAETIERTGARVALVLGNAAYEGGLALENPVNDAEDMAATLEAIGFTVVSETDHGRDEAAAALDEFNQLARGADVALLFYAGHGVEISGENFLIPVDFRLSETSSPRDRALPLRDVLRAMAGAAIQVVVLDACRNAPEALTGGNGASEAGWAPPPAAGGGTVLIYGTAPGATADDNNGERNGLFTKALLEEIQTPREVSELMRRVTRRVREESRQKLAAYPNAGPPQSPWLSTTLVLPFYFVEPEGGGLRDPDAPLSDIERWAREGIAAYGREEYSAAEPNIRRAAEAGHTEAQYYLGAMYYAGRGVEQDPDQAYDWFRLAALRGDGKAQFALGGMYSGGFGRIRRDDERAAEYYLRAAEQDFAVAQFRLGVIYEAGRGVPRDAREAVRWYTLAAEPRPDSTGTLRPGYADAREELERLAREGNADARAALRFL